MGYLSTQVARLSTLDLQVRRDKPDAVHQMRVTVRRVRAVLQAYTTVLSEPATRTLRAELKWLGGVLGEARDTEVLADHLHAGLAAVPTELVLGPAQAQVTAYFAAREASARSELLESLDSARYRALRADLDRLLQRPPLTPAAAEPAARVLPQAVGQACKRAERRERRARRARPATSGTRRCTRSARRPSGSGTPRKRPPPDLAARPDARQTSWPSG
jgi:CHAD domain-containing protein